MKKLVLLLTSVLWLFQLHTNVPSCMAFIFSSQTIPQHNLRTSQCTSILPSHPEGQSQDGQSSPLFLDATSATAANYIHLPPSIALSVDKVKQIYLSPNTTSDVINKRIVQTGLDWSRKQQQPNTENDAYSIQYPNMERVAGCIATVHLQTTLIPTSTADESSSQNYRVSLSGSSDAMLSGGLMAILSHVLSNEQVSAIDVLELDSTTVTSALGLRSILSQGRNDGIASMVRIVQKQIRSLLSEDEPNDPTISDTRQSNIVETRNKPKVAMLLSGGVDSSVALHLLLQQNYDVTAFYLRIWLEDELAHLGECPWEDDLSVCKAVCEHAGNVPLHTVSLGKEYRERVVQYTIDEARKGRTPNPDINCNSRVKFGCFLEYIENSDMEFDYVASGHYARLEEDAIGDTKRRRLYRAPDAVKDQSYFLCALTQKQLSKVLFPIGNYQKSQVRELAADFQLPNGNRPDSQGLCFLGKVKFDDFIASYLGEQPGDIIDALNGDVIGCHNGLWYHTVGQRKGIGPVLFPKATAHGPWYVVAKDQENNIVFVSNRYDEEDFAQARSEFEVEDIRWIAAIPPALSFDRNESWAEIQLDMKIRHGPRIIQGTLLLKDDGSVGNIRLEKKDSGLAPGQYVVFYEKGGYECLGSGVISDLHWTNFLQHHDELKIASTQR